MLELATQRAGWGKPLPAGRARGLAMGQWDDGWIAVIAEISMPTDRTIKIHRMTGVIDIGMPVNIDGLETQVTSAMIYGISGALYGKIDFANGAPVQGNFNDYPVLKMADAPVFDVGIVRSTEPSLGAGEIGTPCVAPALANAVFALRGKRVRTLPCSETWPKMSATTERAVLAGGCFWGVQDLVRKLPGVISTRVGYTGGDVKNATYRNHGTHAEGIEIVFDPTKISYRTLLEFFFQIHDPSTLNRQGNDRGTSYRSGIYYTSEEQKRTALDTIADVDASGSVARQSRDRSCAGVRLLGGRTRTSRLFGDLSQTATRATSSARIGSFPAGRCRRKPSRSLRVKQSARMKPTETNRRWTQVGPGTPCGELLRRYWIPIGPYSQLLENPVKKVRFLGEDLVLFLRPA